MMDDVSAWKLRRLVQSIEKHNRDLVERTILGVFWVFKTTKHQPCRIISAKDQYTLVHQFVIAVHHTPFAGGDYYSLVPMIYINLYTYNDIHIIVPESTTPQKIWKTSAKFN